MRALARSHSYLPEETLRRISKKFQRSGSPPRLPGGWGGLGVGRDGSERNFP